MTAQAILGKQARDSFNHFWANPVYQETKGALRSKGNQGAFFCCP